MLLYLCKGLVLLELVLESLEVVMHTYAYTYVLKHTLFIDATNSYVSVRLSLQTSEVICEFLNLQNSDLKICSIVYGPDENCNNLPYRSQSIPTTLSIAVIDLINFPQVQNEDIYCFVVTASNDTFSVMVKGTFSTGIYASKHVPVRICIHNL